MQPRWVFPVVVLAAMCVTDGGIAMAQQGSNPPVGTQRGMQCQCQYCTQQRMGTAGPGMPVQSEVVAPASGQMMSGYRDSYAGSIIPPMGSYAGMQTGMPEGEMVGANPYAPANWDGNDGAMDAGTGAPVQGAPMNYSGYDPGYANCTNSYCDPTPILGGPTGCFSNFCGSSCFNCAPPTVIASAEATFFFPQFSRGFLQNGVNNGVNGVQTATTNTSLGSTEGTLLLAPRISLGVQGECWGVVTRYWYASSWGTGFTPAVSDSGIPGVTSFDGFKAYTWDLELHRRFTCCDWTLYGFGGLRYASIRNDRSIAINDISAGNVFLASSYSSQQFSGTGITFGLSGTRPVWCGCPWSMYFANRYSVLWGNSGVLAQTSATTSAGGFASSTNGGFTSDSASLFIAEIQAGVQWDAELKCLPGRRAFLRGGFEFQYWNSSSNASASAFSVAANTPGQGTYATSQAGNFLFSLLGISLGTGIMY